MSVATPSEVKWGGGQHGRGRDDYGTPADLYHRLDSEFSFDFDPAPFPRPPGFDGLKVDWGRRCFINPPYGKQTGPFLRKAHSELAAGRTELAVFLVFARTDTAWFHDHVLGKAKEIRFIRGRLRFVGAEDPAPYPSLVAVFARGFGPDAKARVLRPLEAWGGVGPS